MTYGMLGRELEGQLCRYLLHLEQRFSPSSSIPTPSITSGGG
jgi:hypothetical protein